MADANFFSPNTPIDPRKALQYAQQQALAKAMMDEGNAPTDASKYQIGGVAFAASPLEGLAKALKSGVGAYQSKNLQEDYAKDVGSYQSALSEALKGGDLQSMIAASANNPMLADFGKDLAMSKAKSDYEVQKLMAIEGMKIQLDPNKMRMRNAQAIVNGGQPDNSYQGLPEPSVNSQPLPPPSGMGNDMNLPPLPQGALQQPAPMIGSVPMPPSPNQAMGAMVDAQGNQPDAAFNAASPSQNVPQPAAAPQVDYNYQNAYLTMNPDVKVPEGMVFQRGANGQPTLMPDLSYKINEKTKLSNVLSEASGLFDRLDERGGITNEDKNPVENMFISATSGKMGDDYLGRTFADPQSLARMMGSKNQSIRDEITAKREIIKMAVMNATGMSAKQLDSNVELQSFLNSLASPERSLQSQKNVIKGLDKQYGAGILQSPKNETPKDPEEGMTATNPTTGEKLVKRNGQWVTP